ncbi:MAG: bifunctional UDP-N-acetylglucosamine diphosphorylase/glucosamine-1-phosphate N-acetyltransferase GlmU [Candidatus Wallbacteria bacterium]
MEKCKKQLSVVILAAGLGTRMKSKFPKVVFEVAGEPMVSHVIRAVRELGPEKIIPVVGHSRELVMETIKRCHGDFPDIAFVTQLEQKGTGHALLQARAELLPDGYTMVLCGDTPLLTSAILKNLFEFHIGNDSSATVLTTFVKNSAGYGRIVRDEKGHLAAIIEERDASSEIKKINEINTGVYVFSNKHLLDALSKLQPNNDQHEYYLTDSIGILNSQGLKVMAFAETEDYLMMGINNRYELSIANKIMHERINKKHMLAGVTITDPAATYIDAGVMIANDVIIYPNTHIHGSTKIEIDCEIGPDSYIINSKIGPGTKVIGSVIEDSEVSANAKIGPYSHLRPGAKICESVHIGNYVEVKKSIIGKNSKANHLAYIGDAEIGENVNFSAGAITCNYDGVNKNRTKIGDNSFVGTNSSLVAPVEIGENALVGAGSVITKNVPPFALAFERNEQTIKSDYMKKRVLKKK